MKKIAMVVSMLCLGLAVTSSTAMQLEDGFDVKGSIKTRNDAARLAEIEKRKEEEIKRKEEEIKRKRKEELEKRKLGPAVVTVKDENKEAAESDEGKNAYLTYPPEDALDIKMADNAELLVLDNLLATGKTNSSSVFPAGISMAYGSGKEMDYLPGDIESICYLSTTEEYPLGAGNVDPVYKEVYSVTTHPRKVEWAISVLTYTRNGSEKDGLGLENGLYGIPDMKRMKETRIANLLAAAAGIKYDIIDMNAFAGGVNGIRLTTGTLLETNVALESTPVTSNITVEVNNVDVADDSVGLGEVSESDAERVTDESDNSEHSANYGLRKGRKNRQYKNNKNKHSDKKYSEKKSKKQKKNKK
ncbi:MAG: hypothetical protein LBJ13_01485 [Puniceicoccales bacterium]|jgi:hypothetical protein|nr:hypothetical protein [Puniceicoccales bacterium]